MNQLTRLVLLGIGHLEWAMHWPQGFPQIGADVVLVSGPTQLQLHYEGDQARKGRDCKGNV
jgi:hypothetical protein